jgi:hypothetical protein
MVSLLGGMYALKGGIFWFSRPVSKVLAVIPMSCVICSMTLIFMIFICLLGCVHLL